MGKRVHSGQRKGPFAAKTLSSVRYDGRMFVKQGGCKIAAPPSFTGICTENRDFRCGVLQNFCFTTRPSIKSETIQLLYCDQPFTLAYSAAQPATKAVSTASQSPVPAE